MVRIGKQPKRWGLAATLLCWVLLAGLAAGCSQEPEEEELGGEIGPGSGGAAVTEGTVTSDPIETRGGTLLGNLVYDGGYWTPVFIGGSEDTVLYVYENAEDGLTLSALRIGGRPDTPCRFAAALLARDQGYQILAAGDVVNSEGLEFHQVNLVGNGIAQRFFCTELQPKLGVEISVAAVIADPQHPDTGTTGNIEFEQVHHVLNSLEKAP